MSYLEDNSEDEKKVQESLLSKTAGVYHGKAPPGILVSSLLPCLSLFAWGPVWVAPGRDSTCWMKVESASSVENVLWWVSNS